MIIKYEKGKQEQDKDAGVVAGPGGRTAAVSERGARIRHASQSTLHYPSRFNIDWLVDTHGRGIELATDYKDNGAGNVENWKSRGRHEWRNNQNIQLQM